jgi:cytochrome c oxidase subunit 2
MLFLTTARVIIGTQAIPKPEDAMNVTVIGHQFWWEYRYPKLGIVTANELHIPVSDLGELSRPTYLNMSSADVDHSFWVPRLAGKTDVIPNRVNTMWIDPQAARPVPWPMRTVLRHAACEDADTGVCAIAQPTLPPGLPAEAAGRQDFAGNPAAAEGQAVFMHNACINCHAISGTVATGRFGPDLTHLASRDTIGSGAIQNTPENLRKWIDDPNSMKPGCLMPAMHLNDRDLDAITAYLTQLR